MTHRAERLAAAVVLLIAPVVVLITRFVWNPDVPATLPTHWDSHGQVDGTTGQTTFLWICLVISGGLAIGGAVSVMKEHVTRSWGLVRGTAFGAWLLASAYVMVMSASQGATRPGQVHLPWQLGIVLLVVAVAAAVVVTVLLPGEPPRAALSTPSSSIRLRRQEQVTWVGEAHSYALALVSVVLALVAMVAAFWLWPLAIALLVAALASAWTHMVTVRVDDRGVHTLWGPARWPHSTVPLEAIAGAESDDIRPAQWGGWGYRISPHGRAAIVRTGPGLILDLEGRSRYAVTVDHADGAAEAVNALVSRRDE